MRISIGLALLALVLNNNGCTDSSSATNVRDAATVDTQPDVITNPSELPFPRFGADLLFYGVEPQRSTAESFETFHRLFPEVGLDVARLTIHWGVIESADGTYDWSIPDAAVSAFEPDAKLLFTVFAASDWGSGHAKCREAAAAKLKEERNVPYDILNVALSSLPNDMPRYLAFLEAAVGRYGDRVTFWQIENEVYGSSREIEGCNYNDFWLGTKEEYFELLKTSYSRIKAKKPEAVVVAAGIAFPEDGLPPPGALAFPRYVLGEKGVYFDAIDLHLYGCLETVQPRIQLIEGLMNEFAYQRPLISTETGEIDTRCHKDPLFKKSWDSAEELELQAVELVKRHVLAFSHGLESVFRLRLSSYENEPNPAVPWPHMGVTQDNTPDNKRPSYYAWQTMVQMLHGFSQAEPLGPGVYRFGFPTRDDLFVLWSKDGLDTIYDLSGATLASTVEVTPIVVALDAQGKPIVAATETHPANLVPISGRPVFVTSTRP